MQPEKRDYYEVLGVSRSAQPAEIKKAFKRLAMEHHPDRNPGDKAAEERFKEIAEAHEVLSDPERRALYDRYGHAGPRQAGFQGFGGMGVEDILSHFADMMGGFGFGFGGRGSRVERGDDLQVELTITFAEAARGCDKPLELQRLDRCNVCRGTGAKAGTSPVTCHTCGGRGQVATHQGFLTIATTCPTCRGRGSVVREKCDECRGSGVERVHEKITVHVPAGIDDGQTLRVPGKGQAGPPGGQPGHLYVTFHVEPDPRFERSGDDLYTKVPLTFAQAALGATVKVPTLDGEVNLEVKPGTQPGAVHILRGRGLPNVHGRGVGDLAVQLTVAVPKKVTAEQRQLIEALAQLDPAQPAVHEEEEADEGGFFASLRRKKKKRS